MCSVITPGCGGIDTGAGAGADAGIGIGAGTADAGAGTGQNNQRISHCQIRHGTTPTYR